jgi:hypothetical protein
MTASPRVRTTIATVSLLVIGAIAGIAIDRVVQYHTRTITLDTVQEDPVGVIASVIDLTPDQRVRIEQILAKHQVMVDSAWHRTRLDLQATIDTVMREIASVLSPEDAKRFLEVAHELHSGGTVTIRGRPVRLHSSPH